MAGFTFGHFLYLLNGLGWTIVLSLCALVLGALGGFIIMLGRISPRAWLRHLSLAYVQLIQGTPLLIQLFLIYFGLGVLGIEVPALFAAAIAMMLYSAAFLGEIWRGCVNAISAAQFEAADALGLSRWESLVEVILPQAARIATAPTVGFFVQLIKNTSLASVVGFLELTRSAQVINNSLFQPFLVFGIAACLYFAVCYPLSVWSRSLERKLNAGRR